MYSGSDVALIASSGAGENHIAVIERITPALIKAVKIKASLFC
jgi:hypothetical protein